MERRINLSAKTYSKPTANIAVNKSRVKLYEIDGAMPTYYLQKGQEFQIELFNPTTDVVMAKIKLNNKLISQGGLVINPGQRVFLERYIDVAKKFLFDTYDVEDSEETKSAIVNNGDVVVEFYREIIEAPALGIGNFYFNGGFNTTGGSFGGPTTITTYSNNTLSGGSRAKSIVSSNASSTMNLMSLSQERSIETGRVETGGNSSQSLRFIDKKFGTYPFHTVEYKLLPISQKINTVEDLNVKVYCTNCGSKLGKGDKFCSKCGTKA